jgi:hypothetical protein
MQRRHGSAPYNALSLARFDLADNALQWNLDFRAIDRQRGNYLKIPPQLLSRSKIKN